jgi:dTDP-4-amino-4,6-dideoxygalactose transaminase
MSLAILGGTPLRSSAFQAWPQYSSSEEEALIEVLRSGLWGGYGKWVQSFETSFAAMNETKYAVSCSNGTVALEVALRAIGIKCGDEVIVTSFSFVASASAILLAHGVPVFADIDSATMNVSPASIEAVITPKTRAIIVVHFGGHPADMDAIGAIAAKHGLLIVEDCAHAHGARWKGKRVGNFGAVATFSFQGFKLMTAGEGGMVVSNDQTIADAAWSYCNQGRIRDGQWYEHHTLGTNYRLTSFQSVILQTQLKKLPEQTALRTRNANYLRKKLRDVEGIQTAAPDGQVQDNPQYLMTLRYDAAKFAGISRHEFLGAIKAEGIPFREVYPHPLYKNPLFQKQSMENLSCRSLQSMPDYGALHLKECERICKEGLWLEHETFLGTEKDMDDIVSGIRKVQEESHLLAQKQEAVLAGRKS